MARIFQPIATFTLVARAEDASALDLRRLIITELFQQGGAVGWGFHTDLDHATDDRVVYFHMRDATLATYFALMFLCDGRVAQVATAISARAIG